MGTVVPRKAAASSIAGCKRALHTFAAACLQQSVAHECAAAAAAVGWPSAQHELRERAMAPLQPRRKGALTPSFSEFPAKKGKLFYNYYNSGGDADPQIMPPDHGKSSYRSV